MEFFKEDNLAVVEACAKQVDFTIVFRSRKRLVHDVITVEGIALPIFVFKFSLLRSNDNLIFSQMMEMLSVR